MIVVDTNVTSELMRRAPSPVVATWVRGQASAALYTTAIALAEILYGVDRLPAGRRKERLQATAAEVFAAVTNHVLPLDAAAALEYDGIVSDRERAGAPIDGFDAQIAAICRANGARLATSNIDDFQGTGIDLIDPWHDTD